MVKPFLRWAGGKRQLLPELLKHAPPKYKQYYEPFFGGGALLFALTPQEAHINDFNAELINAYEVVKNDVEALIEKLKEHKKNNDAEYYYQVRELDRSPGLKELSKIERAARFIYLNRTCFNGLYRVNSKGQFNVPYGRLKKPNIVNKETLLSVSEYFNQIDINISTGDFEQAVKECKPGDFIYFDPPYDTSTKEFTGYTSQGFDRKEQERLAEVFNKLDDKGCYVLLSNSRTDFIEELYKDFEIHTVKARRSINSNGAGRGAVDEVLIKNY